MDLTPYLESLRRDLAAAAAAGTEEQQRTADLLATTLDASGRLYLMEALSDAAAEITTKLSNASVDIRLRGRDADLVVTELAHADPEPPPATGPVDPAADAGASPPAEPTGDVSRITLRLPEQLKEAVEQAAAGEGSSTNAWLVRVISSAISAGAASGGATRTTPPFPPGRASFGRRVTGYAQA